MSRRGSYLGGGTTITRANRDWFKEGSTDVPDDERRGTTYVPARSKEEQAEYDRFKKNYGMNPTTEISFLSVNKLRAAQLKHEKRESPGVNRQKGKPQGK